LDYSKNHWPARSDGSRHVARYGSLRFSGYVRLYRCSPLHTDKARHGENDSINLSAEDAHRLRHWYLRNSRRRGFADSEIPRACWNLPDPAPPRNVQRECKRRGEGSDIARQAPYTALAADTDASPVYRSDLVGIASLVEVTLDARSTE